MAVKKTTVSFGALIPSIKSREFFRLNLAAMLLDTVFKSELNSRLKAAGVVPASGAFAGVDFTGEFAMFRADVLLPGDADTDAVEKAFHEVLADFASRPVDTKALDGVLTSAYVEEVKLLEKPHYYGMMKGKFMASGGWEFVNSFIQRLNSEKGSISKSTLSFLKDMEFKVSVVRPGKSTFPVSLPSIKKEYFNPENAEESFTAESERAVREWKTGGGKIEIKSYGGSSLDAAESEKRRMRVVLNNSLTVIVNSDPFSEVFAVHLLARNRSLQESKGGIAEFLHRVLVKGTKKLNEQQLKLELASIGASLKTHDNRFIPYDDHYTSNGFSYLRFETVDRFAGRGISLLAEIIASPGFRSDDIKVVRSDILRILEEEEESPRKKSLALLKGLLYRDHPYGMPLYGTRQSIESISAKDLSDFHKLYFSPRNLILTISTSRPPEEILRLVKKSFASMTNPTSKPARSVTVRETSGSPDVRIKMGKSQSYLRMGRIFRAESDDRPALRVLGALVSERLSFRLREKLGLVYSLGFGFEFKGGYAVLTGRFGTRPETLDETEREALKVIREFDPSSVTGHDIERIVNLYISRNVMRRLARVSQAYYQGLEEFQGLPSGTGRAGIAEMRAVSPAEVRRFAVKYLNPENMVKVVVE